MSDTTEHNQLLAGSLLCPRISGSSHHKTATVQALSAHLGEDLEGVLPKQLPGPLNSTPPKCCVTSDSPQESQSSH
ncbi:hypothetical protein DSO57_1006478 [Entomophthora muscae]|uniref:Uncharacterized protein n=1 Tax=Entomophthora muscae TaxID=34485 RepID=A0ACC2RMB6_9FUNG|nr:hypothetical protein DSO57_1006478 [Entomophthora muscae]